MCCTNFSSSTPNRPHSGTANGFPCDDRLLVQILEIVPRRGVVQRLLEDVAARRRRRTRRPGNSSARRSRDARIAAGERRPHDAQARERIRREVARDRRLAERLQLRVDRRRGAAVEDEVDARERLAVVRRRVARLRGAALREPRPQVPVVVHLGHRADVDALAPLRDRLIQRNQVPVALSRSDLRGRDRLLLARAEAGVEVDHRDRRQRPEERRRTAIRTRGPGPSRGTPGARSTPGPSASGSAAGRR